MFSYKFQFLIICFLLSILSACNIDKSPLKTDTGIDPEVIGDWYYTTGATIGRDISFEAIHGIRILEDGVILQLAVELSTGKLAELPESPYGILLFAQNGKFSFRLGFELGPVAIYNSTYSVNAHELKIKTTTENYRIPMLHEKYTASEIGNIVMDPVETQLEMMIGNEFFKNALISSIPSAYAGYFEDDSTLIIDAINQYGYVIIFNLKDFNDAGIYQLGSGTSGRATLYSRNGDVIGVVSTDQHPYSGNINVESFDLMNKRCSGTFEFEIDSVQYSDGIFSVPIYE